MTKRKMMNVLSAGTMFSLFLDGTTENAAKSRKSHISFSACSRNCQQQENVKFEITRKMRNEGIFCCFLYARGIRVLPSKQILKYILCGVNERVVKDDGGITSDV
jgi:hypothetical protein